jgi:hypothetical protein
MLLLPCGLPPIVYQIPSTLKTVHMFRPRELATTHTIMTQSFRGQLKMSSMTSIERHFLRLLTESGVIGSDWQ